MPATETVAISASVPAVIPSTLPEHSPLGASSAERWMNCPGSVALISAVKSGDGYSEEEPDYRRDGVEAHALGAWCLGEGCDAWEAPLADFPSLTEEMMSAVQVYLDFTRSLPGRYRYIEERVHRPELHELFYGTLDFAAIMATKDQADFVDYKHGVGILVEVVRNPQIMYYAYGFIGENRVEYPDGMAIRLHICQPRAVHSDGPIRTWETTAYDIRKWAHEVLKPAMERTINDRYLSVGEWCRFCPAKLVCPAMTALADEFTFRREAPLTQMPVELLGDLFVRWQFLKMMGKALELEVERRGLTGDVVPGSKVVRKITARVFKAEAPLEAQYGEEAWQPRTLKSPAQIESLPEGKVFVAEWAYAPDAGLTVAPLSDRRHPIEVKTIEEKYGDPSQYALTSARGAGKEER